MGWRTEPGWLGFCCLDRCRGIGLAWGKKKVKPGVWTHITGIYDGKKIHLYINGELDVSSPKEGKVTQVAVPLGLGKYGGETYVGGMDEVFLYNRALSVDELKTIMKSFDVALTVSSRDKLATCWASLKQIDRIF
ncbi:TPA: LamG domain-containing protein [Candidatus Poribacteria bacterium]|nr:LamG domain-containing protein [Candidatus Poribacteria bacterium]